MGDFAGIIYPESLNPGRAIQRALRSSPCHGERLREYSFHNIQMAALGCARHEEEDGSFCLALDGHLTNKDSLCKSYGLSPSLSDAAVITATFRANGYNAISHWEGEYAIALFDRKNEELVLVRDRFGQKPLYWFHQQGFFMFGSQLKGLIRSGIVPPEPAVDGFAAYLFFGFIPQDFSSTRSVSRLLPAYYLRYSLNGQKRIENYWSNSREHEEEIEHEFPSKTCCTLLEKALDARVASRSKLCAIWDGTLGGLLTSTLMARSNAREKHLFFASGGPSPAVRERLEDCGVQLHMDPITDRPAFTSLPALLWELDEPVADPLLPNLRHIVERLGKQGATLLAPAGYQSLFGPPPELGGRRKGSRLGQVLNLLPETLMLSGIIPIARFLSRGWAYELLRRYYRTPLHGNYLRARALFVEQEIRDLAPLISPCFDADVFLHKFHNIQRIQERQLELMYVDSKSRLPDSILFTYEHICREVGTQCIAPLIDSDLSRFLSSLPAKVRCGTCPDDALLPRVVRRLLELPDDADFFANSDAAVPENRNFLLSIAPRLIDSELVHSGLINRNGLRRLLQQSRKRPHALKQIWSVLVLEVYYRLYFTRPITATAPETSLIDFLQEN